MMELSNVQVEVTELAKGNFVPSSERQLISAQEVKARDSMTKKEESMEIVEDMLIEVFHVG